MSAFASVLVTLLAGLVLGVASFTAESRTVQFIMLGAATGCALVAVLGIVIAVRSA